MKIIPDSRAPFRHVRGADTEASPLVIQAGHRRRYTAGYMTGVLPVHGRYIDQPCRIQSLTGDIGDPWGTMRRSRSAAASTSI